MTGPGTNSYLIGRGGDLLLVDPGPLIDRHLAALEAALEPGEKIAAIVVTHPHLDHSQSAPEMAYRTGAPILAFGAAGEARSPVMARLSTEGLTGGGEGVDQFFLPDRKVKDCEELSGDWGVVRAIHTPGHMAEHLCLAFGDVLFSGDHAMAWSTSLVSPPDGDMGAYMTSLASLAGRRWQLMLPGHGPEVRNVASRLEELLSHRRMREASILRALAQGRADAATLVHQIYTETPAALLPAAARNILAHLIDLAERNEVVADGSIRPDTVFATNAPNG